MMRKLSAVIAVVGLCAVADEAGAGTSAGPSPAVAEGEGGQLPGGLTKGLGIAKKANDVRELEFTDAEEQELGKQVSQRIRERYGVVQSEAVHRYVSLVGLAMAQGSTRPN